MSHAEWNKKEELLTEQALKHLKQYTMLLAAFTTTARSELALMLKVQEYCYENMNFMKVFQKIILLFYKSKRTAYLWFTRGRVSLLSVFVPRVQTDGTAISLPSFCTVAADIISEEVILKWYKEAHSSKGKIMFLQQMKSFIEWLQSAEEGKILVETRLYFYFIFPLTFFYRCHDFFL